MVLWHAESPSQVRGLLPDGTLVVTQANGQVSFLHFYDGNRCVSLAAVETHLGLKQARPSAAGKRSVRMHQGGTNKRFLPVIRVFVSSTFGDFKSERDALQRHAFPRLMEYCRKHGFEFQAVDLRWGVPSEAGLEHRTMGICLEEIHRSQQVSPEPNFVVLLGNRYGWRPLPEGITEEEFNALLDVARSGRVGGSGDRSAVDVLKQWYVVDENYRSALDIEAPLAFRLQSRRRTDLEGEYGRGPDRRDMPDWLAVQDVLWGLINDEAAFPAARLVNRFTVDWDRHRSEVGAGRSPIPPIVRFQGSATEQEIWAGALSVPDPERHVLAFVRDIVNRDEFPATAVREFFDVTESAEHDEAAARAQHDLRDAVRARLQCAELPRMPHDRLVREGGRVLVHASDELLARFCDDVVERLEKVIRRQVQEYWRPGTTGPLTDNDASPIVPSPEREQELERRAHARILSEHTDRFLGREDELEEIAAYLADDDPHPLVLHGPPGTGKTALLAEAARRADSSGRPAVPVMRFVGMTPESSNASTLLMSLCRELVRTSSSAGESSDRGAALDESESPHEEWRRFLGTATAQQPIAVMLDGLDRLDSSDGGLQLDWIPTLLPPRVRLVVSCISGVEAGESSGAAYRELERTDRLVRTLKILPLRPADALSVLDHWLKLARPPRRLTDKQWEMVKERVAFSGADDCRRPLYLRILFGRCRLWPSGYVPTMDELGLNLEELVDAFVKSMVQVDQHGLTASIGLAYLAAARRGLSEPELLELLHHDEDYGEFLKTWEKDWGHTLPQEATRIPIAPWLRLRQDLDPYLSERVVPGGTVLTFDSRSVCVSVERKLLEGGAAHACIHGRLEDFFRTRGFRLEAPAPNESTPERRQPDLRTVDELPFHVLNRVRHSTAYGSTLGRWDDVINLLTNWAFLETKIEGRLVFGLIDDFDSALDLMPANQPNRQVLFAFRDGVLRNIGFLQEHPADGLPVVLNYVRWLPDRGSRLEASIRGAETLLRRRTCWLRAMGPLHDEYETAIRGTFDIQPRSQTLSFDGESLGVASHDGRVVVYDLAMRRTPRRRRLPSSTVEFVVCCTGTGLGRLAFVDVAGVLRCEDTLFALETRTGEPLAYHPEIGVLAVRSDDSLVAWSPNSGATTVLLRDVPVGIARLEVFPAGDRVLIVCRSPARMWVVNRTDAGWSASVVPYDGPPILDARASADSTRLLVAGMDRSLAILDVANGRILNRSQYAQRAEVAPVHGSPIRCAWNVDSALAVVALSWGSCLVWNHRTDEVLAREPWSSPQSHDRLEYLEFVLGSDRLLIITSNGWRLDAIDGDRRAIAPSREAVVDVALSPPAHVVAAYQNERRIEWRSLDGLTLESASTNSMFHPVRLAARSGDRAVHVGSSDGRVWIQRPDEDPPVPVQVFTESVAALADWPPTSVIAATASGQVVVRDHARNRSTPWGTAGKGPVRLRRILPADSWGMYWVLYDDHTNRSVVLSLATAPYREQEVQRGLAVDFDVCTVSSLLCLGGSAVVALAWSGNDWREVARREMSVDFVKFNGDGRSLVVVPHGGRVVEVLNATTLVTLARHPLASAPTCIDASGQYVALGFEDGHVRAFRTEGLSSCDGEDDI